MHERTRNMMRVALFTALITAGAFIRIPFPLVPFTLQFMFVVLTGLLLERRLALTAVVVYILMGLVGLPVFTGGGGPDYILRPTFGYIVGFAVGVWVSGSIVAARPAERPGYRRFLVASFANFLIVYGLGLIHLIFVTRILLGRDTALAVLFFQGFVVTAPSDVAACLALPLAARRLYPFFRSVPAAPRSQSKTLTSRTPSR
ncbi:MAG: biotin transporter BioY [Bacillota bacterium]|nr:biotin transporter BioY [Bacillota bacterium]